MQRLTSIEPSSTRYIGFPSYCLCLSARHRVDVFWEKEVSGEEPQHDGNRDRDRENSPTTDSGDISSFSVSSRRRKTSLLVVSPGRKALQTINRVAKFALQRIVTKKGPKTLQLARGRQGLGRVTDVRTFEGRRRCGPSCTMLGILY